MQARVEVLAVAVVEEEAEVEAVAEAAELAVTSALDCC